jgi:phage/plasmid-associated DNA primase
MDRAAGFIAGYLEFFETYRCSAKEMHECYEQWCKDAGIKKPLTGNELGKRLNEKGAESKRGHGGRHYWLGVQIAALGDPGDPGVTPFSTRETSSKENGSHWETTSPDVTAVTQDDVMDEAEYQAEHAWRGEQ